jgi:hypothetical protein
LNKLPVVVVQAAVLVGMVGLAEEGAKAGKENQ